MLTLSSMENHIVECNLKAKVVSEYDREVPQSQTADNPMEPRGKSKVGAVKPV